VTTNEEDNDLSGTQTNSCSNDQYEERLLTDADVCTVEGWITTPRGM